MKLILIAAIIIGIVAFMMYQEVETFCGKATNITGIEFQPAYEFPFTLECCGEEGCFGGSFEDLE